MRMTTTVDTESLSAEKADEIREMVSAARFFELPSAISTPTPGVDRFIFKLTVETGGRRHTVEVSEGAVPETLRPLLEQLIAMTRSMPRS